MLISIDDADFAYFVGLVQTDGSFEEGTRNRGKISIELSEIDKESLERIRDAILECNINATLRSRVRDTNFKKETKTYILSIYDFEFRTYMKKYIPVGRKSDIIMQPQDIKKENIKHYIRGIVGGDGSVGFIKNGKPFISLWTKSEKIAITFENFCFLLTNEHRKLTRTTRDGGFSILYSGESAQKIVKELYGECNLCLERKKKSAIDVLRWERPDSMPRRPKGALWTAEEENFARTHSLEECKQELNRSEKSIKIKQYRLRKRQGGDIYDRVEGEI